jgi:hypothetical protein
MLPIVSRFLGLLALWGSYRCWRWMTAIWHWINENGHTEGSPAGLGIFAIGAGADFVLLLAALTLAVIGLVGLLVPGKAWFGRGNQGS